MTSLFGALPVALVTLIVLPEPAPFVAETSARGWWGPRAGRVLLVLLASVTTGLLLVSDPARPVIVSTALVGEGLLAARFLGDGLAWTGPLLHVLVAAIAGTSAQGRFSVWAWPLDPDPGRPGLIIAATLLVLGVISWSRGPAAGRAAS